MAITGAMVEADAVSFTDPDILWDLTPSSSSFANIESWVTGITVTGGDVPITNFSTFTVPMVFVGKRNPFTIVVEMAYTEAALTNPFKQIYDLFDANPGLLQDVQWHPEGAATGNYIYTSSGARLIGCTLPQGTSSGSDPTLFTATLQAPSIAISVGA